MTDWLAVALKGILPGFGATLLLVGVFGPRWLPAALAVGFVAAYALLKEWPASPWSLASGSNDGTQWLVWSVVAAAVVALASADRLGRSTAFLLGGGVLAGQVWLMLTNVRRSWPDEQAATQVAVAVLPLVALFALLSQISARRGGFWVALVLFLCFALDGVVLALGGSLLLAQLASAIAAGIAAELVIALWRRPLWFAASAALPLASAHGGLLLAGYHFAEPAGWAVVAAAAGPAALAVVPSATLTARGARSGAGGAPRTSRGA